MLTGIPANFENDELDEMFADWLWALKEFSVMGIVVLAPVIFSEKKLRHAIAVYPPRLLDAAKQLADSQDFCDTWSASRSPLVVWQTLSSSDRADAANWRNLWRSFGCQSFVRVAFEVPDQRAFECYLFSSDNWQARSEPSMVAWSALNI
jgi:LuxR family transcriptional regulator, quorum-sensing system regulator SolR